MSKKDAFGDDVKEDVSTESFAEMFEKTLTAKALRTGDRFKGEVLRVGKTEIFVATGTPTDGVLPTKDTLDKDGNVTLKVGDQIEVQVLRAREGEILLKLKDRIGSSQDLESLEDAFDMEIPVEGKVTDVVKGGFRVQILGKSAFCPISQMDSVRIEDQQQYVGQKFEFIITQFEEKGRNVVISRRKLLDLQKAEQEGAFLQTAKVGDVLQGTITRLEKFGAFVKLETGPEALIPISEIAWGRINHPSDVVSAGQKVTVKLIKVEELADKLRLAVSLKQGGGEGDPWLQVLQKFPVGTQLEGTVDKKENFGLFVILAPGINGLLPRAKWRDHDDSAKYEAKKKGDKIVVQIDQIMSEEKKISLGVPSEGDDQSWREHKQTGSFGSFADILKGLKPKN